MLYSYASQPDGEIFKDRLRISSSFASPVHSMGFGTWKTTGELFTSEFEKEKVHEEKEEMGEGEENTWREGEKGAER